MNMPFFRCLAFEELEPSRRVEEEILYRNSRARRHPDALLVLDSAAVQLERYAHVLFAMPCHNCRLAHRGDACQRLTAESQCGQPLQLLGSAQLTGGVALECQFDLSVTYAGTVVSDTQQSPPTGFNLDMNGGRSSINGVLNQLLCGRCRALNRLPRGDTGDDLFRQHFYRHICIVISVIYGNISSIAETLERHGLVDSILDSPEPG